MWLFSLSVSQYTAAQTLTRNTVQINHLTRDDVLCVFKVKQPEVVTLIAAIQILITFTLPQAYNYGMKGLRNYSLLMKLEN
jgi:hypothetical protein